MKIGISSTSASLTSSWSDPGKYVMPDGSGLVGDPGAGPSGVDGLRTGRRSPSARPAATGARVSSATRPRVVAVPASATKRLCSAAGSVLSALGANVIAWRSATFASEMSCVRTTEPEASTPNTVSFAPDVSAT